MKTIEGFPNYAVEANGIVWNIKKHKIMKQHTYHGYKYVNLSNGGATKPVSVHRLVAKAYIQNPNNYPCVNHKDEIKSNNNVENLEWCTYQYNNHYGVGKPTERAANARKRKVSQYTKSGELLRTYESACEAQRETTIKQSNISKCCLKRKYFESAGGFIWKFAD